jgi:hypothetical protein
MSPVVPQHTRLDFRHPLPMHWPVADAPHPFLFRAMAYNHTRQCLTLPGPAQAGGAPFSLGPGTGFLAYFSFYLISFMISGRSFTAGMHLTGIFRRCPTWLMREPARSDR